MFPPNENFSAKEGKGRSLLQKGTPWLNAVAGMDNRVHNMWITQLNTLSGDIEKTSFARMEHIINLGGGRGRSCFSFQFMKAGKCDSFDSFGILVDNHITHGSTAKVLQY